MSVMVSPDNFENKREEKAMYDEKLEALIDEAGREKVFNAAINAGWEPRSTPPKWVWRELAYQVINEQA